MPVCEREGGGGVVVKSRSVMEGQGEGPPGKVERKICQKVTGGQLVTWLKP